MDYIFDKDFFLQVFKFNTFEVSSDKKIQKIYYRNGVYQGQGYFSKSSLFIKNGQGLFYTNQGDAFYGVFVDDQIQGEGNCFFWDGSFFRGNFQENKLHGNSVFLKSNGDVILMQFARGVLHGNLTYFLAKKPYAIVMHVEQGVFTKNLKRFSFNQDQMESVKKKIIRKVFEDSQESQILLTSKDIQKYLKNKNEESRLLGCFMVESSHLIIGCVNEQLILQGVGIIVDFNGNITIGDFN